MLNRPVALLQSPVSALLLAACAGSRASIAGDATRLEDLMTRGRFEEAVREAAELRENDPSEGAYVELHRKASLGYLLAVGRQVTFENRDEAALEIFARAVEVAPESEQAREWYHKTRTKLALRWNLIGEEFHANGNIDGALEAYGKALEYEPEMLSAREGAAQLLLVKNFQEGLSNRYYNEGVRALHDYFLRVSRGRFQYTQKYDPGDPRAEQREDEVETRLAEQRFSQATALEAAGKYAAARNEYYIVLLMKPGDPAAQAGYDRMKIESDAKHTLEEAAMATLRGDFDSARDLLQGGQEKTTMQRQIFEDRLATLDDDRVRAQYEQAVILEGDFQFEEAATAYRHILEERQWFEDARARLEFVEERIERSAELYEQAGTVGSEEDRLKVLGEIELYWPEYKDVREQIIALRRKLGLEIVPAPSDPPR